jgi:hypothetical protein
MKPPFFSVQALHRYGAQGVLNEEKIYYAALDDKLQRICRLGVSTYGSTAFFLGPGLDVDPSLVVSALSLYY